MKQEIADRPPSNLGMELDRLRTVKNRSDSYRPKGVNYLFQSNKICVSASEENNKGKLFQSSGKL